jgi:hypothetical protein
MSRDSQVVVLDSTLFLRCIQVYSKIWSAVQSQANFARITRNLEVIQLDVVAASDMS